MMGGNIGQGRKKLSMLTGGSAIMARDDDPVLSGSAGVQSVIVRATSILPVVLTQG